jgi:protein-tyrosine sulfotransferase
MRRRFATHNSSPARWLRRRRCRHVSDQSPVIVAGSQRSGTTLLRVILDSHPRIACGPESSLLTGSFLPDKLAERFETPLDEVWALHDRASDHAHFVELFLTRYAQRRGRSRWAEKTPQNIRHLDFILRHLPRAKIIHVIRDGRDVVSSIRTHPRYRIVDGRTVTTNIRRPLRPCVMSWLRDTAAGMRWRGAPNYREVRYEELVGAPEPVLRTLCEFLDEPWDPALLEYHRQQQGASRDPRHFIASAAAAEPMHQQALQRWRKDLTDDELRLFYQLAGQRMAELGYDLSAQIEPAPAPAGRQ